jgi:ABC-2 type transport system permease protein
MFGFGLIFGAMSKEIQDVRGDALEYYTTMGGTDSVVDAFLASMVGMGGMTAAIYAVQILLRLRADEAGGTAEPVLATGVTRTRWVLGHVANAVAGCVVLVLVFTVAVGITAGQVLGDTADRVRDLALAGLAQLPAVLLVGAFVVAVTGVVPRWAGALSWSLLIAVLMVGPLFGPGLGLPGWVQDLSPFTHVPKAPAAAVTAPPLLVLMGGCCALAVVGLLAFRRRDLVLPA